MMQSGWYKFSQLALQYHYGPQTAAIDFTPSDSHGDASGVLRVHWAYLSNCGCLCLSTLHTTCKPPYHLYLLWPFWSSNLFNQSRYCTLHESVDGDGDNSRELSESQALEVGSSSGASLPQSRALAWHKLPSIQSERGWWEKKEDQKKRQRPVHQISLPIEAQTKQLLPAPTHREK